MMTFFIAIHVVACLILIILVLIQRGRGGGLVDSFQGVESMFGTKTNDFLTKTTTVFSVVFFITCLSLAVLSVKKSKSLMSGNIKLPAASAAKDVSKDIVREPEAAAVQETSKTAPVKTEPSKTPVSSVK